MRYPTTESGYTRNYQNNGNSPVSYVAEDQGPQVAPKKESAYGELLEKQVKTSSMWLEMF